MILDVSRCGFVALCLYSRHVGRKPGSVLVVAAQGAHPTETSVEDWSAIVRAETEGLTLELSPDCILRGMDTTSLQIGRVAQKTGLSVDAIRFYEKSGLLPRPARTQSGYRLYEEREIADLEFIQKAQQLGFSLNEIRELFSIQRHPHEVCEHVRDLIAQKLVVVRAKIADLQRLETELARALRQCRTALRQPSKHRDSCPVLEAIAKSRPQRKKL
jgi:DNA-binding transcriptional MerR regulator